MSSAAALYAGTVLLRKTFEAIAQRSVTSLFSRLHSRFRGQHQIEALQEELESRLQVLSLPVDMCVQYVVRENSVLQGALDMAIRVINDIVAFQEELEAQVYNEATVKMSPVDVESRLRSFLSRLDAILPYMAMAVNAVSLLKSARNDFSFARMMEASYLIRSTEGVVMSITAKLHKYETKLTLPHWQEKLLLCSASVKRVNHSTEDVLADFVLEIDAEEEDVEGCSHISVPISSIASVGSSTLHVLGLGEHELKAVLLFDVSESSLDSSETLNQAQEQSARTSHYALQCLALDPDDDEKSQNSESSSRADGGGGFGSTNSKLGVLEYVLRLCMLQVREEKSHWLVADERIKMFFSDPRFISEPVKNMVKAQKRLESTPTQSKGTPLTRTPSGPARLSNRKSVSDMFYDLSLEKP